MTEGWGGRVMTFKWALLRRYLRVWRESNFSFFPVRALERGSEWKNGTRLAVPPARPNTRRLVIFSAASAQNRAERVRASEPRGFLWGHPAHNPCARRAVVYGRASCATSSCNMEIGSCGCGANRSIDVDRSQESAASLDRRLERIGSGRGGFLIRGFSRRESRNWMEYFYLFCLTLSFEIRVEILASDISRDIRWQFHSSRGM